MTRNEFETRTGVQVTDTEFWSINEVYNNSDVDKDEFCRLWKKMNPVRVANAKAEKDAQEKRMQEMEKAMDIVTRSCSYDFDADAMTTLKRREVNFLESIGIDMYDTYGYKKLYTIRYEILVKFGLVA
jgi:hypothetical protein